MLPAGYIATVVIDLTPSRRGAWLAGEGRDEPPETDDAREGRKGLSAEDVARFEATRALAISASEARAVWTHDVDGSPIYDDDPRLAHLFRAR